MSKTPEILRGATRQYKHNDGSDGFVVAFEQVETIKIVGQLESSIAQLKREKAELEQQLSAIKEFALALSRGGFEEFKFNDSHRPITAPQEARE